MKNILNESRLKKIVRESINRVLNEGSADQNDYNRWDEIKEYLGADQMLDYVYNYLTGDQVRELIELFIRDLDLSDEEEDFSEDEFDEDEF